MRMQPVFHEERATGSIESGLLSSDASALELQQRIECDEYLPDNHRCGTGEWRT